jgi:hypothetical protein
LQSVKLQSRFSGTTDSSPVRFLGRGLRAEE